MESEDVTMEFVEVQQGDEHYSDTSMSQCESDTEQLLERSARDVPLDINGKKYEDLILEDFQNTIFETTEEAEDFYDNYSLAIGFSIRKNKKDTGVDGNITRRRWVCSKQGKRDKKWYDNPNKKKRARKRETRENCKAAFTVRYSKERCGYFVSEFRTEHSHQCAAGDHVHFLRSHRVVKESDVAQVTAMREASIKTSFAYEYMVHQAGGYEYVGFTIKDLYNKMDYARQEAMLDGDAQAAIAFMNAKAQQDPEFYCKFNVDSEGRLANMFWRDSGSLYDYNCFSDVLEFDTTYKTNIYDRPLAVFVGSNNHRATILFGCSLLVDETVETHTWLLKTFLHSMKGKKPVSIMTDGDEAMRRSIVDVLPESRHRLCAWHIAKNLQDNIKDPDIRSDFRKCIYKNMSPQEWEETWNNMLATHGIADNSWINMMYKKCERWVEAFNVGHFFGGMSSTQRCEGMHKNLKKGVGKFCELYEVMPRVDKALCRLREKAKKDDFDNMNSTPVLETHMRVMEKEVADIFTHDLYLLIKDEIGKENKFVISRVEKSTDKKLYLLAQYNHPNREWSVDMYHTNPKMEMICSCKMFESDGIPCRHIFCVLKSEHIDKFPAALVNKRWTKKARSEIIVPIPGSSEGVSPKVRQTARFSSLTSRMDQICYKASMAEDEDFRKISVELDKLSIMVGKFKLREDEFIPNEGGVGTVIRDPEVAKTKVRNDNATVDRDKSTGERRCTYCHELGHNRRGCEARKLAERRVAFESATTENILQSQTMTECTVDLLSSCIESPPTTSTSQPGIHHH